MTTKLITPNALQFAEAVEPSSVRFDYRNQAWTRDGRYVNCGHHPDDPCQCYGRLHAGERANPDDLR